MRIDFKKQEKRKKNVWKYEKKNKNKPKLLLLKSVLDQSMMKPWRKNENKTKVECQCSTLGEKKWKKKNCCLHTPQKITIMLLPSAHPIAHPVNTGPSKAHPIC